MLNIVGEPTDIIMEHRRYLNGINFGTICEEIEHEKNIQCVKLKRRKNNAIKVIQARHSDYNYNTIYKYYKRWINDGKPRNYIITDKRKNNTKNMALPIDIEMQMASKIKERYHQHQQVSYNTISQMAKQEWNTLHPDQFNKFYASNGWVYNFSHRYSLSSQAVSLRSSSRDHKDLTDSPLEVKRFKDAYLQYTTLYVLKYVINFDETSRGSLTGRIQTIAPKNNHRQPRILNRIKGRGLSIGCSITGTGEKLQSVLVAKGKSKKSLGKYKQYCNDKRCILTYSESGWFTDTQIIKVLDIIYKYTKGSNSLCIWDDYAAHKTERVIEKAKQYNIQLLAVPKGLTWALQPLDVKINGAYKQMMNSYWLKNAYNENPSNYHTNLCDTVLGCYDNINSSLIKSSFDCLL